MTSASSIAIGTEIALLEEENLRIAEAEGYPPLAITGKMYYEDLDGSIWYEVKTEYNTTSWLTAAYPSRNAYDEKFSFAEDINDARSIAEDEARRAA